MSEYKSLQCGLWEGVIKWNGLYVCCYKCHYTEHGNLTCRVVDGHQYLVCCGIGRLCLKEKV